MSVVQGLREKLKASGALQRFQGLPARDQKALLLLLGALLLAAAYVLLWQPAQRNSQLAKQDFIQQRELNAYMNSQAAALKQRPVSTSEVVSAERLQALVASSAAAKGLLLERLESNEPGDVQVSLASASFNDVLAWLAELQLQGVKVAEASLDRAVEGQVVARLRLTLG